MKTEDTGQTDGRKHAGTETKLHHRGMYQKQTDMDTQTQRHRVKNKQSTNIITHYQTSVTYMISHAWKL